MKQPDMGMHIPTGRKGSHAFFHGSWISLCYERRKNEIKTGGLITSVDVSHWRGCRFYQLLNPIWASVKKDGKLLSLTQTEEWDGDGEP